MASARRGPDRIAEIAAALDLSEALLISERWNDVDEILEAALSLASTLGEHLWEGHVLNFLGANCLAQREYTRALERLHAALLLSSGTRSNIEAVVEGNLCEAYLGIGDSQAALRHASNSLALRQHLGDLEEVGKGLYRMAMVKQALGDHTAVVELCRQVLDDNNPSRWPLYTARLLDVMGTSLRACGETDRALKCWREASLIYEKFRDHRTADLQHRVRSLEADQ